MTAVCATHHDDSNFSIYSGIAKLAPSDNTYQTLTTSEMIDQNNMSSTQSPRDSFFSDPNAHHTKPIRPPRSNASRLQTPAAQKDAPKSAVLTVEALTDLSPADNDEVATYKNTRIKDFLHRLPDPEDPSNSPPDTDLDILEAEHQNHYDDDNDDEEASVPSPTPKVPNKPRKVRPHTRHHCEDNTLPSSPTARLSNARPQARPQPHHTPLAPRDMHLWYRFQTMQSEETYAQFWRHKAWLTLQYDSNKRVALFVGVDTKEHAVKIHKHMLWLRDKWLGTRCGLFYHVMGFEDDEESN